MGMLHRNVKRGFETVHRAGYKAAMTSVRLRDVAAAAGVSAGTASNVFNRPEAVRPELRERVLAAARTLGYAGPEPAARALRRGRAHLIALVTDEAATYVLGDPFGRRLLAGIASVCDETGDGLTIASTAGAASGGWSIETALVDGFILFCFAERDETLAKAVARGLPLVTVDSARAPGVPSVGIDDARAAEEAAGHLLGLGHRRFGVLSMELAKDGSTGPVSAERAAAAPASGSRARLEGYRRALAAAGVGPEAAPVFETQNDREGVQAGVAWLMDRPDPPTALLAMSDVMALAALDALAARGLRAPQDVSLVGFDDAPEAARAHPPLTTVGQPAEEKGRAAAQMLLGLREARDLVLPAALVRRATTGPPPPRR